MSVGVEHDEGKREEICRIRVVENSWIIGMVPLGKTLHDAVDLLSLSWQPKTRQKLSGRNN